MFEKDTFMSLFKNKLLLLCIAIVAATIVLAILFQPLLILVTGIGLPAACIVGIIFFLSWTPPKVIPKPAKVEIKAEPKELIADGKSRSTITLQLLDKEGKPIPATNDTEVKLTATGGKIERPLVKIPKGEEAGKTVLISSRESGTIDVSADARGLKSIAITLEFKEKARFCMGCGNRMSEKDKKCQKCGASPDQFTGAAKICKNCERSGKTTYIPLTAEFCSECGPKQAPTEG